MHSKPEILFTLSDCMGGVASFNRNIINYSRLIKNFHSKVILLRAEEDKRPAFTETFNADEVLTFHYSYKENQYHVQKRLNRLFGTNAGAIVTDNSLTVYSAARFSNPKTIFYLLHDYFYVNQVISLNSLVDVCIAHSSFFADAVYAANPELFAGRTQYIPYGVQQLDAMPVKKDENLNLVFLGRMDEGKGAGLLRDIENLLQAQEVNANWTIIGKGPLKSQVVKQWSGKANVSFYEPATTKEIYDILGKQDIFVFPTTFEGTPVSILECLANGVVTITNDLPGGIRDIVKENIGFRCELNNLGQFARHIVALNEDRNKLATMQQNCYQLAKEQYDITKNADNYFRLFEQYGSLKRTSRKAAPGMSRLDKKNIPNSLVKLLRNRK